jgi:Tol biopolymer transport system component
VQSAKLSPDGLTIAFDGRRADGTSGVWLRRLDEPRPVEVPNIENDSTLVGWSPDGKEIAVRTAHGIVGARIEGWLVRPLVPTTSGWPSVWGSGGIMLRGGEAGLHRITIPTGEDQVIIPGLVLHPRFLPDGRRFLYTGRTDQNSTGNPEGLFLSSVDSPDSRRLVIPVRSTGVAAGDELLFAQDGTLFAQQFDAEAGKVSGQPTPIVDGVYFFHPNGFADFDAAGTTIVYRTPPPDDTPVWFDRRGALVGTMGMPGIFGAARISPDGRRAVFYLSDRRRGTGDLWLYDIARGTTARLTNDEWSEGSVRWSPDGRSIAYGSDRSGPPDVYVQDVDGGAPPRLVFASPGVDYPVAWLPGGRLLLWSSQQYKVVRLDGTVDETVSDLPRGGRSGLAVSPDGRWIAWSSGESGREEVYVEPFGRQGLRVQVSVGGGERPVWSGDGRSIYYLAKHTIFQALVRAGATFASDPPSPVFTAGTEIEAFDVTPDGQRFLVLRNPPPDFLPVNVLVNWRSKIK